jgi:hypothetical protein
MGLKEKNNTCLRRESNSECPAILPRNWMIEKQAYYAYVSLGHVCVTTVAVKINKNHSFWVCVCRLRYPVCNVHAPYYIVICGLSGYCILCHYFLTDTILEKTWLKMKCLFGLFLQLLSATFLIVRRIHRDIIINVLTPSSKVPVVRILMNFLDRFSKNNEILTFMKTHPIQWKLICSLSTHRHAGRRAHIYDYLTKLIVAFRNFAKAPNKMCWLEET